MRDGRGVSADRTQFCPGDRVLCNVRLIHFTIQATKSSERRGVGYSGHFRAFGGTMDARIELVLKALSPDSRYKVRPAQQAAMAGLSVSRFYDLFREATGTAPARYLRRCRFEKAEELLRTTNMSIKEIANHTGILDCSHFVRDFAKSYGMSPRAYRRALRGRRNTIECRQS